MNKARLIKREEVKKQETPEPKVQGNSISQSVQSVKEWINQHQERRSKDARTAFALLFAEPQEV